jgi:hypothetical protein
MRVGAWGTAAAPGKHAQQHDHGLTRIVI